MDQPTSPEKHARPPRIGMLDTARGFALLAMASYHFTWDIEFMGYLTPGTASSGWLKIYARSIAATFLFLSGFSLVLANSPAIRWQSFWKRLGVIAAAALVISVGTYFFLHDEWIFFGILHSIAVLSIIGLLFYRLPIAICVLAWALLSGAWIADSFIWPRSLHSAFFDAWALQWVGLSDTVPRTNDYVPVFPWIVAFVAGIIAARLAIQRNWFEKLASFPTGPKLAALLGRHSLVFYLVHQLILLPLAYGISLVIPPEKVDPAVEYLGQCQASCTIQESAAICERFCACTLTEMQKENLFSPIPGQNKQEAENKMQSLAFMCSMKARGEQQ